jgi:hypothetical protein
MSDRQAFPTVSSGNRPRDGNAAIAAYINAINLRDWYLAGI